MLRRRSTTLCPMFGRLMRRYTVYRFWGRLPPMEFCHVQNWLCVQVLHSPILAGLLHGTRAVGVRQTATLSRGRHPFSAGWPSRWESAHILVVNNSCVIFSEQTFCYLQNVCWQLRGIAWRLTAASLCTLSPMTGTDPEMICKHDDRIKMYSTVSSCIHHLLPPARDSDLTSRLRRASIYPRPRNRTNRYKSFIHHALLNYQ